MLNQFSRTALLLGNDNIEKLLLKKVAVFGIGGVGGHCAEALARSGVGALDLFDKDRICITNINRQIIATTKTIGQYKADVMKERILDINPKAEVSAFKLFYLPETAEQVDLSAYDYIIDAIDTLSAKIELAYRAWLMGIPIISSMGAGNKINPAAFKVADIYETAVCPLAKIMRKELRKKGVEALKTVYSEEVPIKPMGNISKNCRFDATLPGSTTGKLRQPPGSNAFVPAVAGLIMAGEVIKDLTGFMPIDREVDS